MSSHQPTQAWVIGVHWVPTRVKQAVEWDGFYALPRNGTKIVVEERGEFTIMDSDQFYREFQWV